MIHLLAVPKDTMFSLRSCFATRSSPSLSELGKAAYPQTGFLGAADIGRAKLEVKGPTSLPEPASRWVQTVHGNAYGDLFHHVYHRPSSNYFYWNSLFGWKWFIFSMTLADTAMWQLSWINYKSLGGRGLFDVFWHFVSYPSYLSVVIQH